MIRFNRLNIILYWLFVAILAFYLVFVLCVVYFERFKKIHYQQKIMRMIYGGRPDDKRKN